MKKIVQTIGMLVFAFSVNISCMSAQPSQTSKNEKAAEIAKNLNDQKFVFQAQEALPMGGRTRPLTSYYEIKVKNDTLISSLPYFGRVFTAPMNPADGGYMFTSTQIDYKATQAKKGSWNVVIIPGDRHKGEKFVLTAFSNGSASLQVMSNDRQPITFRGIIR